MTEKPHQLSIKYKGSSNSSAHKNTALEWFPWARNICSKVGVNNSAQTQLDKDMKSWKRGDRPSRHQVFKSTHWPKLLFTATTAHSTSTKCHVTIFMCRVFVRLKALKHIVTCLHVKKSHTGNVTLHPLYEIVDLLLSAANKSIVSCW